MAVGLLEPLGRPEQTPFKIKEFKTDSRGRTRYFYLKIIEEEI
jgi:hypothetical protein